jgi:hypothetical protein
MDVNMMEAIITSRYAPLVFLQNLNAFTTVDYMKYLPRYNGEGEVTFEENLVAFYSFADKFNIKHVYIWMRLFV